jgi:hypothetical protein
MPQEIKIQRLHRNVEDQTDVFYLCAGKVFEDRNQVEKLVIVGVREPAADGYRVLRVENVRSRRIVDNNRLSEVTANL